MREHKIEKGGEGEEGREGGSTREREMYVRKKNEGRGRGSKQFSTQASHSFSSQNLLTNNEGGECEPERLGACQKARRRQQKGRTGGRREEERKKKGGDRED